MKKEEEYYASILGLDGQVTLEAAKKAYKVMAAQYHPDKVAHLGERLRQVAEDEMKSINEAYAYFKGRQVTQRQVEEERRRKEEEARRAEERRRQEAAREATRLAEEERRRKEEVRLAEERRPKDDRRIERATITLINNGHDVFYDHDHKKWHIWKKGGFGLKRIAKNLRELERMAKKYSEER